jgi:hypothetical protein
MTETQLLDRVRQLREQGRSPKEIARCLGVRPATVSPLVRALAEERSAAATEPAVAGCWVSPGWSIGLGLEGFADWPGLGVSCPGQSGLVAVLVAREHRYGRVSVCGYLVDTWCLGAKDTLGPRVMNLSELPGFVKTYFGAFEGDALAAPIELAQHLVLGAVAYARSLGFQPEEGFAATAGHLGSLDGPSAITFGKEGKPYYIEGPYDNSVRNMRTLERSVGKDNFTFMVSLD